MTDKKISLLVNNQVPEFIREENPKFITFLEAYYEFLDQNGYGKSKDLRYLSDVDESLDEFEQQFYNMFMPFLPRDQQINKELLIKNILPLYLAKGSDKSYQLLFRLLFGEEIQVEKPVNNILRASDGRWSVENYLRVEIILRSEYTSDGVQTVYYLPFQIDPSFVSVTINGVITSNYVVRKEYQKLTFNTAPAEGDLIQISYSNFDTNVIENRKITGLSSGAEAIIERIGRRSTGGQVFYQFFINQKTLIGTFSEGEQLFVDLFVNDTLVPLTLQSYSDIATINVTSGGANYSIGDQVIIRGTSRTPAVAIVGDVSTGVISEIAINDGGTGYKVDNNIISQGISTDIFFSKITSVDDSGTITPNSITFNTDLISDFANIAISNTDYGFPHAGTENVNSVISQALTLSTISGLGPVAAINVVTSKITSQTSLQLIGQPSVLYGNTSIGDLGIIGRIDVLEGGLNYNVGEQLIFTNNIYYGGQGANAYVSNVSANGAITKITVVNGGLAYDPGLPPTITVNTAYGSGANLIIGSIMGRYLDIVPKILNDVLGRVLSIRILDSGVGYTTAPTIDLSRSGNGQATAEAIMRTALIELPGKWSTSDSIISSDDIRLQGRDYYINYSYVINSKVEFEKYKAILKNLLHPAGFINYSKYRIYDTANSVSTISSDSSVIKTVSGTVSISNNSNNIVGINSAYLVAESLGIIQSGNVIAIGNDVVNVVSIDSNTSITVDEVFTSNANSEIIKILT